MAAADTTTDWPNDLTPLVDHDLPAGDDECDDIHSGSDPTVYSDRVVGLVKRLDVLVGVVVCLFGDVQVLDEGRGLDEEEDAHQRQLHDAPGAEEGAAEGTLGAAQLHLGGESK